MRRDPQINLEVDATNQHFEVASRTTKPPRKARDRT
jgi:hypothetical protein